MTKILVQHKLVLVVVINKGSEIRVFVIKFYGYLEYTEATIPRIIVTLLLYKTTNNCDELVPVNLLQCLIKDAAKASLWMTGECFLEYLESFILHVKFSQAIKALLLVNNHGSHIIAGINYSRENGIIMIGFPPHTTHRLQPLNVSFFGTVENVL